MSDRRRQDLVYPPGPEAQLEPRKRGPRPEAEGLPLTARLLSRFSLIRHDEEAILRALRQVPYVDRHHARMALCQALGGHYTNAGPRAQALCERVFGIDTVHVPGERVKAEEEEPASTEDTTSLHAAEAEPRREPVSEPEVAFDEFDQGRIQTLGGILRRLVSQPPFPAAPELLALLAAAESHVAQAALSDLSRALLPGEGLYGRTYYQALQQAAGERAVSHHISGRREMIERMLPGRHQAGRAQGLQPLPLETRLLRREPQPGAGQLLGSWDRSATPGAKARRHAEAEERLAEDHPALAVLAQRGGEPLPEAVLGRMNRLLGYDFSHVRIHTDARAVELAELLGARALAFGTQLYFGAGQFAPGTPAGDRLLAHELIHIVQFDEGRLPAGHGAGVEVSRPEDGAEQEAEARTQGLEKVAARSAGTDVLESVAAQEKAGGFREATRMTGSAPRSARQTRTGTPRLDEPAQRSGREAARAAGLEVAPDASSDWVQALQRGRENAAGDVALPAGEGEPMAPALRARMEAAFGHEFSHVRIHTDSAAGDAARQMKAHAVTQGAHVFFGHGEFAPGTAEGDRLLLHELTHVVQADEGRLPSRGGLSSPHDTHEQEAYAAETGLVGALGRADTGEIAPRPPTSAQSQGSQGPVSRQLVSRDRDGAAANAATPAKTGPATSEDALLGDLPTASAAPTPPASRTEDANVGPAPRAAPLAPEPEAKAAPGAAEAPAQISAPAGVPAMREAPPGSPTVAPPVASAVPVPPVLARPIEWSARAREEGTRQSARLLEAATSAASAVRAAAGAEAARTTTAFVAARSRLEAEAATAKTNIQARAASAKTKLESDLAVLSGRLDADFAAREERARGAVEAARTQLAQGAETEAQRAITESAARAERALSLADLQGGGGDGPLVAGQRDIARRVANEVAAQCVQTGADAATEVRKAGASQLSGVAAHLDDVLASLAEAREGARAKLDGMRGASLASLDEKAAEAGAEIDVRMTEASAALSTRESELTGWLTRQAETEAAAILARATELTGSIEQSFAALAAAYDQCQAEVDAALADATDATPESIAETNAGVVGELGRIWQEGAAPQIAQAAQAVAMLTSQGTGVAEGFTTVVAEAERSSLEGAGEQGAQLLLVATRFAESCATVEARAQDSAQQGMAAELAEADRALTAHRSDVDAALGEALGKLSAAVDRQLAWEDEQIAAAAAKITAGQAKAAGEYETAKAEARARDQGEQTTSRGWLGDLWNFFDDLAQRTLEWFQEKLGRVWGNIIGGILAGIIYVVGVVVCAAAWLGAQVINVLWGFIWGETAIPGYGGGVFAFIADVIAGVLVYGDIRDVFKYWIWRPLWGEGPWWLNLLMGGIALLGLIPLVGDALKAILKGLKAGSKTALKWLAKLVGEELAERIARALGEEAAERLARRLAEDLGEELAGRLIREIGAEATEELLERLGRDTLRKLAQDLSGATIRRLADEIGERALRKLAEELSGAAIERIAGDLSQEAIEKLLRTVGGSTIEELHTHLGKDALLKLLEGLRGVTIKEYFDALGGPALRNLARDLDGYAVKELMEALGAPTLRRLADDLGGAVVKELLDELGEATLKKLATELGGTAIKELFDGLGAMALKKLATELGGRAIKELADGLTPAILRKLSVDLGGNAIKQLAYDLTPDILKRLATDLDGAVVQRLATELGAPALKELAAELAPTTIRDLLDTLGKDMLLRLKTSLGVDGLKQITDAITPAQLKAFVDEVGEQAIEEFGAKALAEVGRHLNPTELLDLLTSPNTTMGFLRSFCEQAGAGAMLRSAIGHFGSVADLGRVLAHAEAHAMPVATLRSFLDQCTRLGWKKIPQIGEFFRHVGASGRWADAMNWAEAFHAVGNRFGLKTPVTGGKVGGAVMDTTRIGGTDVVTTVDDLAHWKSGHTFEEYALTMGNAGRGNFSSLWPAGTSDAAIRSDMARILGDGALPPVVAQAASTGRATTTIGGYFVGLTKVGSDVRLVQFYPDPGNPSIPKAVMRGIVQLFESM